MFLLETEVPKAMGNIITGSNDGPPIDLYNLYANACNFGIGPAELSLRFPLHRVQAVHFSGGKWVAEPAPNPEKRMRVLDDRLHDVPPSAFELLALLAQHAPQPLDVIIERDGEYPAFDSLLAQLETARSGLQLGRQSATHLRKAA